MNIPLFKVFMADTAVKATGEVLKSGYIGQGPKVDEFEKQLKEEFKNDYVLTVNSCTSALQLAIHLIAPKNGFSESDEILVPPLTCFATASAVIANKVKIKWVDIDPKTCNIDLDDLERKVNKNTKGIVVVHWGGASVDLDRLKSIQEKYNALYGVDLPVIEDCAHCWNSFYKGTQIGNSGNICCFSFQAIKFLTTGDGGLIILPNSQLYHRAKNLRWFGLDRDAGSNFRCIQDITESGFKYHCTDIAAAIGISNLPHMSELVQKHKDNAAYLRSKLQGIQKITLLEYDSNIDPSYWIFTMLVENRDGFIKQLESNGVMASPVHARCDKHTCVKEFASFLPGMDFLQNRHVSIPCGWWMTKEDCDYIVNCIKGGW